MCQLGTPSATQEFSVSGLMAETKIELIFCFQELEQQQNQNCDQNQNRPKMQGPKVYIYIYNFFFLWEPSLKQSDMKGLSFYYKSFCFESMCSNSSEFPSTLVSEKICQIEKVKIERKFLQYLSNYISFFVFVFFFFLNYEL